MIFLCLTYSTTITIISYQTLTIERVIHFQILFGLYICKYTHSKYYQSITFRKLQVNPLISLSAFNYTCLCNEMKSKDLIIYYLLLIANNSISIKLQIVKRILITNQPLFLVRNKVFIIFLYLTLCNLLAYIIYASATIKYL